MRRLLAIGRVLFAVAALVEGGSVAAQTNSVIIISLDGFRPDFYLSAEFTNACATLTRLRDAGSYAKAALPPYPSLTYPGHASILSGVFPARHSVTANNRFSPPTPEDRGFWFASDIKAPTICDAAHAAGLTVGSVTWPSTAGSKSIDWDVPEFWTTPFGNDMALIRRYASPGLLNEIEPTVGPLARERLDNVIKHDEFTAGCAAEIIRRHQPNLLLVHLLEIDKLQHQGGRAAPGLSDALRRIDAHIAKLIDATKKAGTYERTTFIVLGDHGFANVQHQIAANVLLIQNGFIKMDGRKVADWTAMVQNTGGSAGVYLKRPWEKDTAGKVRELFEKNATDSSGNRLFCIIDKDQLVKLGGPANAAFYLEGSAGYMFSGTLYGSSVINNASIKGNHGFLPATPGLATGFIAAGRGIKKGVVLDTIGLVDVAPTVAPLLGVRLANTDGRVLKEILRDVALRPTAAADEHSVVLQPQKIHEDCLELKAGETLEYSFTASQPVEFNIHYHKGDDVNYPVKENSVKSSQHVFEAASDQEYCLMWSNNGTGAVTLVYRCMR